MTSMAGISGKAPAHGNDVRLVAVEDRSGTRTALALTAIALLTVAFGLGFHAAGGGLGTRLPPFFAVWDPHVSAYVLVGLPVVAIAAAAALPLLRGRGGVPAFLVAAFAISLAARLGMSLIGDGAGGWYAVFGADPESANEYLPALPAVHSLGLRDFLDRFAEISPTLPIHPSAHPPGILVLLDLTGIDTAEGFAAVVIVIAAMAAPLTYVLARRVGAGELRARAGAMLIAFSPASLLYGVLSTDAMFATLGLAAACLLVGRGAWNWLGGSLALALASFLSWALLAIGAFAGVFQLLRRGLWPALAMAAIAGAVLIVAYALLFAATGFDPIGSVRSAGDAYALGIANARPYLFWLFGSPVAFAVALGVPTAWYAARALGTADAVAIGLATIVVVSVLLGLTKAETERIWLFMGPLAAVAASSILPTGRMPAIICILLAQALATQILLDTIW
jgi:methylthioxylose transferase